MKLFSKLAAIVALVAISACAAAPQSAYAATGCDAHGVGNNTMTHSTNNSAYTIQDGKATVKFNVVGNNCKLSVTMIAWKAPNGTTGMPYSQQTMFAHKTAVFSEGLHQMTIDLPNCYFQVDTVTGTKLTGSTGEAYNYDSRQVAFMHGGTKSCVAPKPVVHTTVPTPTPTPTPTPVTPATPHVVAAVAARPAELPHTGPEAAMGTFLAASGAGTLVHRYASRKSRR